MTDQSPPANDAASKNKASLKKKAASIKEAFGKLTGDKVTQAKGTAQKADADISTSQNTR